MTPERGGLIRRPVIFRRSIRTTLPFCLAALALIGTASASTVVFQDGQVEKNVTILSESDAHIEILMKGGKIRFPRAAIKLIDGQPAVLAVPKPPASAGAVPVPPPARPAVPAADAVAARPQEQPDPRPAATPSAAPGAPAETAPDAAQTAPSALSSPPPTAVIPFAPNYRHSWNFEWVLLGILLGGGIWMRSLQWVQKDLLGRRCDPRVWTLVALFLPIAGSAAYAASAFCGDFLRRRKKPVANPGPPASAPDAVKLPWMEKMPDPAEHLASKGGTQILDRPSGVFDLSSLGMSDDMLATFLGVIQSRSGMILATGPSGAGKTSTLYAVLRQLDSSQLNIMTIEDPPEYELAGATQLAVDSNAGITYESGLRSILSQDPDVILIGEMRDTEAGEVALRAALTGHLVLSSLHTKDALGAFAQLQDMGIERNQMASGLLMVIAQRLVRVLCPHCRQPYACQGDELESLGFSFEPGSQLFAASGCDECLGTGFKGRTGLFELLVMDDDLRRAIGEGADESTIDSLAVERGFRSYRYDGAEKVLLGITTVEEVLQTV